MRENYKMIDTSKLRTRIIKKYMSIRAFSEVVHNSEFFIIQYLEGNKFLGQSIIDEWAAALEISPIEYDEYFFRTI